MARPANRACALFATLGLATAFLGATSGWLIGLTGDNSQVPAAVVAGLLAALLGWLFLASGREGILASVLASFVAIVFCGAVFVAERITSSLVVDDALNLLQERQELLDWCAGFELYINGERMKGGLPPLPPEYVCPLP